MDTKQDHSNEHENEGSKPLQPMQLRSQDEEEDSVPRVAIVRSSTPKPLSFGLGMTTKGQRGQGESSGQSMFPVEAPLAPPLPEEDVSTSNRPLVSVGSTPLPLGDKEAPLEEVPAEFIWLFEYAIEMDNAVLNSAERLDGLALLYGPAVLKGYEITFDVVRSRSGGVVATILPSRLRGAEVWGVLYRVPRRCAEPQDEEAALLDRVHGATPPDGLFERLEVVVHDAYRTRDIDCITYIASATARNAFHLLPRDKQVPDPAYVESLLESAKQQKLPDGYLNELALLISTEKVPPRVPTLATDRPMEQNTEPLPVLDDKQKPVQTPLPSDVMPPDTLPKPETLPKGPVGLIAFATYLSMVLLGVFVLAVLQGLGFGSDYLTPHFMLLGIPWFMLVYGLLGGCLSSMIWLVKREGVRLKLPSFMLIVWFTRPLIGAVLAALAFMFLNSGAFMFNGDIATHATLYSLVAILAGACEGWLFIQKY